MTNPTVAAGRDSRDALVTCRATALAAVRCPAAWLFAAIYALAAVLVVLTGRAVDLAPAVEPLLLLLLTGLVIVPLTQAGAGGPALPGRRPEGGSPPSEKGAPPPAWSAAKPVPRARLLLPAGAALLYACVVPVAALFSARVPLVALLTLLGQATIPLLAALLAGAGWRELGFDRGHRSGAATLCLVLALAAAVGALAAAGLLRADTVVAASAGFLVSAAVPEELHLRAVLMTRLACLWGPGWGIVLSALVFGAYHVTANAGYFNGAPYPVALALGIVFEGPLGLVFAIVLVRTRNLLAPIVFHAGLDAVNFAVLPHVQRFFH